jgi:hypothetical protein
MMVLMEAQRRNSFPNSEILLTSRFCFLGSLGLSFCVPRIFQATMEKSVRCSRERK